MYENKVHVIRMKPRIMDSFICFHIYESRGCSVSVVSGYGLNERAIEFRSPEEARDFSSTLWSRPALGSTQLPLQWLPRAISPGVKRGLGVTLTTYLHLVPR
jgi:hypothetical protein